MTRRIERAFARAKKEGRAALIVFVEAGDPDLATTARLVPALADAGADLIELGVPFSDPSPTGRRSSGPASARWPRARRFRRCWTPSPDLREGRSGRRSSFFSYANPILAMGEEPFAGCAAASGFDGVLVTDLPPEEGRDIRHDAPARGAGSGLSPRSDVP